MRITITSVMLLCTVVCMGQDNHGEQFFNADGSQNRSMVGGSLTCLMILFPMQFGELTLMVV